MTYVGKCSKCSKEAAWNTPCIDKAGKLFCNKCAYESNEILQGVKQWLNEDGTFVRIPEWKRSHISVCQEFTDTVEHFYLAWYNNGSICYPVGEDENYLSPEELINKIETMLANGDFKCTDCKGIYKEGEEGGYPLFAGRVCKSCWEEHLKAIKQEYKEGHVCRMCRQAYSECCC